MEINGKNKKELKAIFRNKVAGGKYASRETLLAYAFIRGVPYAVLERVINEDHESFGKGRDEFLRYLAYSIAVMVCSNAYDKLNHEQYYASVKAVREDAIRWIMMKYDCEQASQRESAA